MKIKKIPETQLFSTQPAASSQESNIAVISGCNFDSEDGLKVETTQDNKPVQKTYTKETQDEYGNKTILTYSCTDDTLISKEIYYSYGHKHIEFYRKGTTIKEKVVEKNSDDKIILEEQYYKNAPFGLKQRKEFNAETDEVALEEEYQNGQENPDTRISYQRQETIKEKFLNGILEETTIYRKDDTLKEHSYPIMTPDGKVWEKVIFRIDGTIYSKGTYSDSECRKLIQNERYYRNGKIAGKTTADNGRIISERYNKEGRLGNTDILGGNGKYLAERIIYNKDSKEFLHTIYNSQGEIISYEKGSSENPETNFQKKLLNGKIDAPYKQGMAGTCYIASTVKSLLQTPKGRQILEDALSYDEKTKTSTVRFKGINKSYTFTDEEIEKATVRLGTGDPDFTVFLMGFEKYRTEFKGKVIDSGLGKEVMYVLTGKEGDSNIVFVMPIAIDNTTLDQLQESMEKHQMVITAGTPPENPYTELTDEEMESGLRNNHSYAVLKITDDYVVVNESNTDTNITLSRKTFMEKFVVYCDYNLDEE